MPASSDELRQVLREAREEVERWPTWLRSDDVKHAVEQLREGGEQAPPPVVGAPREDR